MIQSNIIDYTINKNVNRYFSPRNPVGFLAHLRFELLRIESNNPAYSIHYKLVLIRMERTVALAKHSKTRGVKWHLKKTRTLRKPSNLVQVPCQSSQILSLCKLDKMNTYQYDPNVYSYTGQPQPVEYGSGPYATQPVDATVYATQPAPQDYHPSIEGKFEQVFVSPPSTLSRFNFADAQFLRSQAPESGKWRDLPFALLFFLNVIGTSTFYSCLSAWRNLCILTHPPLNQSLYLVLPSAAQTRQLMKDGFLI